MCQFITSVSNSFGFIESSLCQWMYCKMNNSKILTALLFCAVLQNADFFSLPGPRPQGMWSGVNSQDHTEEDAFMIANGVTQEEIEEFHRSNGFVPPDSQDKGEGQGRSFGKIGETLKFWNWPAFGNFRYWIEEQRRRTTTIKPMPFYIVNNPDESYGFNDIYVTSRPSYFM